MCTWLVASDACVYTLNEALLLQVAMCACTVCTTKTDHRAVSLSWLWEATTLAAAHVLQTTDVYSYQHFCKPAAHKLGGAPGFKYSTRNTAYPMHQSVELPWKYACILLPITTLAVRMSGKHMACSRHGRQVWPTTKT